MKKIRIVLLAAAALCSYPVTAYAQPDEEAEVEGEEAAGDEEGVEGEGEGEDVEGEELGEEEDEEQSAEDAALDAELGLGGDGEEDGGGLGNICKIDPEACPT